MEVPNADFVLTRPTTRTISWNIFEYHMKSIEQIHLSVFSAVLAYQLKGN